MSLLSPPPQPSHVTCISACEACVIACDAYAAQLRRVGTPDSHLMDATTCIQALQLAAHAMGSGARIAPAACAACARSCESLAHDCTLLGQPGYMRCAQACLRAARECYKVAQASARLPRLLPAVHAARPAHALMS